MNVTYERRWSWLRFMNQTAIAWYPSATRYGVFAVFVSSVLSSMIEKTALKSSGVNAFVRLGSLPRIEMNSKSGSFNFDNDLNFSRVPRISGSVL